MKHEFAFSRTNFILLAIGMAVVVVGMVLMSGPGSTSESFNPDIFSPTRTKVAPLVCLAGYVFIVVAILFHRPKRSADEVENNKEK